MNTATDAESEYSDLILRANTAAQVVLAWVLMLLSVILLSPLLLTKVVSLDGITTWLTRVTGFGFRLLPFICLPFFVIHEGLHIVFLSAALLHPAIRFIGWMPLTFSTPETFQVGMRIEAPDFDERSAAVHWLLIMTCAAPALGFIPVAIVIGHIANPYLLAYIVVTSLWCVPSAGDRMVIAQSVRGLRGR